MKEPQRRSDCPISSALDLLGDKWSLLVMRDMLLSGTSHYRDFLASEEGIATNILADRLARLEAAGLIARTSDDPRSGKQEYHPTGKGTDLIPLLLEMIAWSARHDPGVAVPGVLIAEINKDRAGVAQTIRDLGSVEAFLAALLWLTIAAKLLDNLAWALRCDSDHGPHRVRQRYARHIELDRRGLCPLSELPVKLGAEVEGDPYRFRPDRRSASGPGTGFHATESGGSHLGLAPLPLCCHNRTFHSGTHRSMRSPATSRQALRPVSGIGRPKL